MIQVGDGFGLPSSVHDGLEVLPPLSRVSENIQLHYPRQTAVSEEKCQAYLRLLWYERERLGLSDQTTSQFIAFKNGECDVVNEYCCKVYNDHLVYERNERKEECRAQELVLTWSPVG